MIGLSGPTATGVDEIKIKVVRSMPTCQTIHRSGYIIVAANISYFLGISFHIGDLQFSYTDANTNHLFLEPSDWMTVPSNFASAAHGVEGVCLFGFDDVKIRYQEDNSVYFDATAYPIADHSIYLSGNTTNNYGFEVTFHIICFD
jgi:hypothetical protein